jgi:hypothetical protein
MMGITTAPMIPTKRFGLMTILTLTFVILSLIFVPIAAGTSWWTLASTGVSSGVGTTEAGLGQVCFFGSGFNGCYTYQQILGVSYFGPAFKPVADTFGLAGVFMLVAIVFVILTLVFFLIGIFFPKVGYLTAIFALVGATMNLVAPLYLFAALPGAVKSVTIGGISPYSFVSGFFGSGAAFGSTYTYGGGAGWFLAVVSSIFFFLTFIFSLFLTRRLIPLGNIQFGGAAPQPAYYSPPGYQPYQQPMQSMQPMQPMTGPTMATSMPTAAPTAQKFCPRCGSPAQGTATFCANCGGPF